METNLQVYSQISIIAGYFVLMLLCKLMFENLSLFGILLIFAYFCRLFYRMIARK